MDDQNVGVKDAIETATHAATIGSLALRIGTVALQAGNSGNNTKPPEQKQPQVSDDAKSCWERWEEFCEDCCDWG